MKLSEVAIHHSRSNLEEEEKIDWFKYGKGFTLHRLQEVDEIKEDNSKVKLGRINWTRSASEGHYPYALNWKVLYAR